MERTTITVQTLLLRKACQLVGGVSKLASFLHAPPAAVLRWLRGNEKPPSRVFLDCADVVLFHERHLQG